MTDFGTRVLRINLKAVIGLMRWPFAPDTSLQVLDNKLPDDCAFVRIDHLDPDGLHLYVIVASQTWRGHRTDPLTPTRFKYTSGPNQLVVVPPELSERSH